MVNPIIKSSTANIPMVETHFYGWLIQNSTGSHIQDKRQYLVEHGFIIGQDRLDDKTSEALKYINEHYYFNLFSEN